MFSEAPLSCPEDSPQVGCEGEIVKDEVVIRATNLSKIYHIYERPADRLKQAIFPRLRRWIGLPPKSYDRQFWALKDVSFDIKKGETVGIIGCNGAGKSTLLQMICGTIFPSSGSVELKGRVAALLELGSGFNPEFSGRENVYMNASILGLSTEEIDAKFDDITAFADIGEFLEQPVKTYSSGMVMRLAFAVIAHVDADILVIDEALAVGDAFFVQKCMRFLRKFMENGTILFVSHDTGSVVNLCNKAIWLKEGKIISQGSPKEISEQYLEQIYASQQNVDLVSTGLVQEDKTEVEKPKRDMRLNFINQTNLRNDIEVFEFDPEESAFGQGGARTVNVQLTDENGDSLSWIVGGERVTLKVDCIAETDLFSPIIGFHFNDRLGQILFGDNTYLSYMDNPEQLEAGEYFSAAFHFVMPILPKGDYTITTAIAEGTQMEHVQHHWVNDAIAVKSHTTRVCTGLVGLTDMSIQIKRTRV